MIKMFNDCVYGIEFIREIEAISRLDKVPINDAERMFMV